MEEIFIDIKWYEWLYQISNLGRAKSLNYNQTWKEKLLKPIIYDKWYPGIHIRKNDKYKILKINRLVAQAFLWLDINNRKIFVCHKDDNPLNNRTDNLFLWTRKDNMRDMINKWRSNHQKNKRALIKFWKYKIEDFDKDWLYDDWFISY